MKASLLFLAVALAPAVTLAQTTADQPPVMDVHPADLARLIDGADRLVVTEPSDTAEGQPRVLFESRDRRDLDALKAALKIKAPESPTLCFCTASPVLTLYAKGQKTGELLDYHGIELGCSLWQSDAIVVDPEPLLKWFDKRKITGPRTEYEWDQKVRKAGDEAWRKWVAAVPPVLASCWAAADLSNGSVSDLAPFRKALETLVKDRNERILALAGWYGSGAGPWTGFPAYEDVPERLLLDYPTPDLVAAFDGKELSPAQLEGAARLFGDWWFGQQRPDDLDKLPARLAARLLQHSLASPDEDKRARAQFAFGGR